MVEVLKERSKNILQVYCIKERVLNEGIYAWVPPVAAIATPEKGGGWISDDLDYADLEPRYGGSRGSESRTIASEGQRYNQLQLETATNNKEWASSFSSNKTY